MTGTVTYSKGVSLLAKVLQERMEKELTPEAEADRRRFEVSYRDVGCTCFQSPPCNHCIHPGNPANQAEDESCWVKPQEVDGAAVMDITRQMVG